MRKQFKTVTLVLLLMGSLVLFASCQPSVAEKADQNEESIAPSTIEWSPDSDCAVCHDTESGTRMTYHADLECVECHTDTAGLESAHEGVSTDDKTPSRLSKTNVDEDACLSCHPGYSELAGLTASSTVLTDSEGTVVNPHEIKETGADDHASIVCADCHDEHSGKTVEDSASTLCIGCHHQNVYECGTCHE